jgi:glyoxylase-like metal-dependent hydrolase (beta-lactamase superfamily II)
METMFVALILIALTMATGNPPAETPEKGRIYIFESDANGFNTHTVFYDDGQEVVAFDAQFTENQAEQALAFLKTKTGHPLRWLVVTHPNPDKFNGIPAFKRAGAAVIMSEETAHHLASIHAYKKHYFVEVAKAFTEQTYPALPAPDQTFADQFTLRTANGTTIALRELHQSGISANQTVAYIQEANALIVGDLVHHRAHAWLEGPILNGQPAYNSQNWTRTLTTLQNSYPATTLIYGGRGETASLSVSIAEQIAYLERAEQLTRNYVASLPGKTLTDKKANVDYAALTTLFERAFPGYELSYLIRYGSYGLVMAL